MPTSSFFPDFNHGLSKTLTTSHVKRTGDIEEFPALDPIASYPVRVEVATGEVKVSLSVGSGERPAAKALCRRNRTNTDSVVIIGSGASGHSCAETLRQEGFTGNVVLVTKEKYLPYDRTKVTKAMSLSAAKLALRSEEYYQVRTRHVQTHCRGSYEVRHRFVVFDTRSVLSNVIHSQKFPGW